MTESEKTTQERRVSLPLVAVILSALALAIAVYAWYQVAVEARLDANQQQLTLDRIESKADQAGAEQEKDRARLAAAEQQLGALGNQLQSGIKQSEAAQNLRFEAFRGEFDSLRNAVEQVYLDLGRSVDTWMLEETEQLLMLANQRLSLVGDVELASTALSLADEKLVEIADPALFPVRKKIAEEIAALDQVPRVDTAGTSLKLISLMDSIDGLNLAEDMNAPEWETGMAEQPADGAAASFTSQFMSDIGKLVRIRKVDETQMPKLKPVQRFLVNENLKLMLNAAQMAALRRDQGLYTANLVRAEQWLMRYFDPGSEVNQRVAEEIRMLMKSAVAVDFPVISGSLETLRHEMRERAQR